MTLISEQRVLKKQKQKLGWRGENEISQKNCSSTLAVSEMKTKTTLRLHFTLVRIKKTSQISKNKCWRGFGKRNTHSLLVGWPTAPTTLEIKILKKQKINLSCDPTILLLDIYSKLSIFFASLFTIAKK